MTFTLPTLTRRHTLEFIPVRAGTDLQNELGGPDIRISRLGDRTAVRITLQPQGRDCGGDAWIAALWRGLSEPVRLALPLPKSGVGSPGSPVVDGGGQTGMSLDVTGLTAGYEIKAGQKLSIVHSGIRYLHFATAAVTANGSGEASVAILPMLRVSPADADVVELAQPYIEGSIRPGDGWSEEWTGTVPISFTIQERR